MEKGRADAGGRTSMVIFRGCALIAPLTPFQTVYLLAQPITKSLNKYLASKNASVWPKHAPSQTMGIPAKPYTAPPASVRIELGKNTAAHSVISVTATQYSPAVAFQSCYHMAGMPAQTELSGMPRDENCANTHL